MAYGYSHCPDFACSGRASRCRHRRRTAFARVHRMYTRTACLEGYRQLLGELTSKAIAA